MSTAVLVAAAFLAANTPALLVSPAELASRIADPSLVILHVANRESEFEAGRVPGAKFVLYSAIADNGDALGSELPPVSKLVALFESLGVSDASHVVVYGTPIAATRLFFTLDYLGHPHVRVLNGGLAAWKADGRQVESGASRTSGGASRPGQAGTPRFVPRVVTERRALAEWIEPRLNSASAMTLLDVRPDAEFTGADGGMNGAHAPGHIPGARQLLWTTLLQPDGRFLPDTALRAAFEKAGVTAAVPVVTYCMVGMRASVVYFAARHLGYDARMYDGSIVDWSRRMLPVKTGRP